MKLRLTLAIICLFGAMTAQAGTITWTLDSLMVDGTLNAPIIEGGAPGVVTGVNWDFVYEANPVNNSWTEDLVLHLTAPTSETLCLGTFNASLATGADYCDDLFGAPADEDLGGLASPGVLIASGSSSLLNGLSADGNWSLLAWEGFDDFDFDGSFIVGTLTVQFDDITPAPEPGIIMLLGLGLAGLGFARRRG